MQGGVYAMVPGYMPWHIRARVRAPVSVGVRTVSVRVRIRVMEVIVIRCRYMQGEYMPCRLA